MKLPRKQSCTLADIRSCLFNWTGFLEISISHSQSSLASNWRIIQPIEDGRITNNLCNLFDEFEIILLEIRYLIGSILYHILKTLLYFGEIGARNI